MNLCSVVSENQALVAATPYYMSLGGSSILEVMLGDELVYTYGLELQNRPAITRNCTQVHVAFV